MIPKETIETIIETAKILDVANDFVNDLKKSGASYKGTCPMCGEPKLNISPGKKIFKCYHFCGFKGNNAITFLMESQKMDYPTALKYCADKYNIPIEEVADKKGPQNKGGNKQLSFRDVQLQLSGLTNGDQKALVVQDKDTKKIVDVFESGTLDQFGRIVPGDDMIIWYIGLDSKQVTYQKPKTSKFEPLFRVRWQNPELHCDASGKPMKYKSPYGSGSHLYIPEIVRKAYNEARKIKRLYIQEGEKKAEKACKHGIFSVGIMGIHSIANKGHLPMEFQQLIKTCGIEEVVFVVDSDYDEIRKNVLGPYNIEDRPYSFYKAVLNYRDYFKTFSNTGIFLEIYFGYMLKNDNNDKGIDDILTNTLSTKENDLYQDFETAINDKENNYKGTFVQLFKITTAAESKIKEYFSIQSIEIFTNRHFEILKNLPEFTFGYHKWRIVDGIAELSQPLTNDETYWEKISWYDAKGKEHTDYKFKYKRAYNFLKNRGFGRIMMADNKFIFCHIVNRIVYIVEPYQIRDFIMQLTLEIAPEDVQELLYRGGKMYMGPDSLSNIAFVVPSFEISEKSSQCLFFNEVYWKILADKIEEQSINNLQNNVWSDKVKNAKVSLISEPMIKITPINQEFINNLPDDKKDEFSDKIGQFGIDLTDHAISCHFIKFLINTGDFYWSKYLHIKTREPLEKDNRTLKEIFETNLHFVSKITAIGYLLHKYRDRSCEKAVIGMDGKNSEIGESNGRTGKSLLGYAIGKMIPQVYIPGKAKDLTEDRFIFEQVTEKTDNIFIDDTRPNFDFEFLFPVITGIMLINAKGDKKFSLPSHLVPKIYLTTNHAINGNSGSFRDRQAYICFSDYYNENYKPIHDFGINFFDEWEQDQWNLFYNFMAFCLQTYFKLGLVSPPMEIVEKRRLRQYIGDEFINWANDYYGIIDDEDPNDVDDSFNMNKQNTRSEIFNNFLEKCPLQKKYVTAKTFKNKLKAWCKYKDLIFNPHPDKDKSGKDNKSGGVEYITIGNAHFKNF